MRWLGRLLDNLRGATTPPEFQEGTSSEPLTSEVVPMPPLKLRRMVGPTDPEAFDNPGGAPLFGLSPHAYESVVDFGCGCGRVARQLLLQNPRPRRYIGIDVHRGMIDWCQRHLSPLDPSFQFFHHDVYAHSYAPGNRLQLAQPFPVGDGESSLFIAVSVFTHLYSGQTEYYLSEVARTLRPDGVAFTTWFFFDRDSFPFFVEGPFCLFAGERDPTQAVIYDRRWFLDTVRRLGLGVKATTPPPVPGHQWTVSLTKRDRDTVDQFPLGEQGAEWLCGATSKPMASPSVPPEVAQSTKVHSVDLQGESRWPRPPALFGALAELDLARRELVKAKKRWR